jgi:hypothetical protein
MVFLKLTTNRILSKNKITIEGDDIALDIIDATNDGVSGIGITKAVGSFKLSELVTKFSQDHGCIALLPKKMINDEVSDLVALETTQLSLPEKSKSGESFDSEETTPGKFLSGSPWSVVNGRFRSYAYVYILTPTKDCSVDDLIIIYRDTDSADITINGDTPSAVSIASTKQFLDAWMPISIDGPGTIKAGEKLEYTVSSTNGTIVYLETDIGIINRTRIASGKSFVLDAYGLESGETITIKTGYKFWHGVSKKVITVE